MPVSSGVATYPIDTSVLAASALASTPSPLIRRAAPASLRIVTRKRQVGSSVAPGLSTSSRVSEPPSARKSWCGRAGVPSRRGRYIQLSRSCSASGTASRRSAIDTMRPDSTSAAVGRWSESTSRAAESQPTMMSPSAFLFSSSVLWSTTAIAATMPRIRPSTTRKEVSRAVLRVLPPAPSRVSSRSSSVRPGFQMKEKIVPKAFRNRPPAWSPGASEPVSSEVIDTACMIRKSLGQRRRT